MRTLLLVLVLAALAAALLIFLRQPARTPPRPPPPAQIELPLVSPPAALSQPVTPRERRLAPGMDGPGIPAWSPPLRPE